MAREDKERFRGEFADIYKEMPRPFAGKVESEQQYFPKRLEQWGLPSEADLDTETVYKAGKSYGGPTEKSLVSRFQKTKASEEETLREETTQLGDQMRSLGLVNTPLHRMKEQRLLRKFGRTMDPFKQELVEGVKENVGRWWEKTGRQFEEPLYGGDYMQSIERTSEIPTWEASIKKGRQSDLRAWDEMKSAKGFKGVAKFLGGLLENVGATLGMGDKPWDYAGLGSAKEMVKQAKVTPSGDVQYFGEYEAQQPGVLGKSHGAITRDAWKKWAGQKGPSGSHPLVDSPMLSEGVVKMPEEFAGLEMPDILKPKKLEEFQSGITYGGLMRDYRTKSPQLV